MTDQEIQDNGYDCGFFDKEPNWEMLDLLDENQRDLWAKSAKEGMSDQLDDAAAAIADYHVMCGYD